MKFSKKNYGHNNLTRSIINIDPIKILLVILTLSTILVSAKEKYPLKKNTIKVALLLDTSNSMGWGQPTKLWYGIRSAAAIGYIALTGLDRVTVTAFGNPDNKPDNFPSRRGKRR